MQEYQSLKQEIEALGSEVGQLPATNSEAVSLCSVADPSELGQAIGIGN